MGWSPVRGRERAAE